MEDEIPMAFSLDDRVLTGCGVGLSLALALLD